jgi:hypothetical protein
MKKILFGVILSVIVLSIKTVHGQTEATIEAFASISTNSLNNVLVVVTSSNITEDVVVEMRNLRGTGEATFFPSDGTITNIRQSTVLTVKGKTLSNVVSNMIMSAKVGTNSLAANIFTVIDTGEIGFVQAKVLAEQVLAGIIQPQVGLPITVELIGDGSEYLITFENIHEEGVLKGDFAAKVRVGSSSGNILDMESSP